MARTKGSCLRVGVAVVVLLGLGLGVPAHGAAGPDDGGPSEAMCKNTAPSFVVINYHLKKSDRPRPDDDSPFERGQKSVLQRVLNDNTMSAIGVIVSDKGDIFTTESPLQYPDNIAAITVTGIDGATMQAEASRLLVKAPGSILRIVGRRPGTWAALKFAAMGEVTPGTTLYAITLRNGDPRRIYTRLCEYGLGWDPSPRGAGRSLRVSSSPELAVICNAKGQPVGATVCREIDLGPAGPVWRGRDLLADEGISAEQQRQFEGRLEADFGKSIYEVKITFRPDPREDDRMGEGRYSYGPYGPIDSERVGGQERLTYGLGFAPDKVLLPEALGRDTVAGIETITVKIGDKQAPARFGGVLKQCEATVIELQEGTLPQTMPFAADGRLVRTEPFWAVFVREMAGMDVLVGYSRWITKEQGYGDLWYPVVERSMQFGSWLVDRQGRLVGLCCRARREQDRLDRYLLPDVYGRYGGMTTSSPTMRRATGTSYIGQAEGSRLFEAADLIPILDQLPYNYDTHIRHLSQEEQKRRVWLGVEFTRPSREIVKQMGLRTQTQDGRIGLMVNRVYAGSPAARIKLVEGDILLKLAVPGLPWPIELMAGVRPTHEMPNYEEADIPREFEEMGLRMPRGRPWPNRDNSLTRMLADIGAGTSVTLTMIHAGQTLEKEFMIEQAPPDMLSAAKYKNDKLGLTVKDMTYEVRAALRLNDSEAAVVVAKIEQGTPSALARINPYELIRAVDGEAVDNVRTFEKLITAASEAKKDSVRLTVEWMGRTRLADLKFEAKADIGAFPRGLLPGL